MFHTGDLPFPDLDHLFRRFFSGCLTFLLMAYFLFDVGKTLYKDLSGKSQPSDPPQPTLYALLVTTNLVSQPCTCGFCDPSRGTRVPEHINQIGYDLRLQVSTNFLPIVSPPPNP